MVGLWHPPHPTLRNDSRNLVGSLVLSTSIGHGESDCDRDRRQNHRRALIGVHCLAEKVDCSIKILVGWTRCGRTSSPAKSACASRITLFDAISLGGGLLLLTVD